MLLLGQGLARFAHSVCLVGYVQLRSLTPASLVRKYLPPLKLLLQTVFVESFKFFHVLCDIEVGFVFLLYFLSLRNFFFLRSSWVGQIIEPLGIFPLEALQFQFSSDDLLEILVISIFFHPFLCISNTLPYNFFLLSSYIFFWHCRIFLSIILIYWFMSPELFFMLAAKRLL